MRPSSPVRVVSLCSLCALTIAALLITALPLLRPPAPLPRPAPPLAETLVHVRTIPQRLKVLGYQREKFGSWTPALLGDCPAGDTRDWVLHESFSLSSCTPTGLIDDPYTASPLHPGETDIDHIFPLSAAWDMGAHRWTPAQRSRFANDPLNLVAVGRVANRDKSDQLPAQWLPENPHARCWYSERLSYIAYSYDLALTTDDVRAMKAACRSGIAIL